MGGGVGGMGGTMGGGAPADAAGAELGGIPPTPDAGDAAPSEGEGSPGCMVMNGLPEGDGTLQVGGMTRSFRLRLPAGYTSSRAWPLVLALHPNGGSGIGYWDGDGRPIRQIVRDKAILVLPLARGGGGDWDWRGNLPADLAYFEALLQRLTGQLCVDRDASSPWAFRAAAHLPACWAASARTSGPSPPAVQSSISTATPARTGRPPGSPSARVS